MHPAALLHDIGKLGVSNMILDKPGRPTEEEFAQIRKHPDYSQQILEQVGAFRQLPTWLPPTMVTATIAAWRARAFLGLPACWPSRTCTKPRRPGAHTAMP
jgi:hypothetical protein